jgi:hypothetical protein
MAIRASILALLLAGTAMAEAPPSSWYRGLVGRSATDLDTPERYEKNKEVEMELRVDGSGRASGRYFYFGAAGRGRGADITIQGRVTPEGRVRLEEKVGSRVTGRWQGAFDGSQISGTWTDPAGKRKLRFVLQQLDDSEGEEHQVTPDVGWRARRVVGTNLRLPFLTKHPRPEVMKKVNDSIGASFEEHKCDPTVSFPAWPDDYEATWKVGYASADLLSFEVVEDWYCGFQPMNERVTFTFDLTTGEPVHFRALFRDYEREEDAILGTLFADGKREEGCLEAAASRATDGRKLVNGIVILGDDFGFHLTPTALHVSENSLPTGMSACAMNAEVPYEKLRRFVEPGSPIALILDARGPAR